MSNALFLDASNLNVLYKVNGKFTLGLSYAACPEKLVIDSQALGNPYDIYISMWPRPKGEGDVIISGLSHGRVPFVALEQEVRAVLEYTSKFPGRNNIYLCNALANFVVPSRVSNFQAVIPYGSRWALVDVSDKILDKLTVFPGQREFYEVMGEDFTCYGDSDIVDVDTLRAQYPELAEFKKNILVPLVPMIVSYRSTYSMSMEDVYAALDGYVPEPEEPVVEEKEPAPLPEPEPEAMPRPKREKAKFHIDWIAAVLGIVICFGAFVTGYGHSMRNVASTIQTAKMGTTAFKEDITPYQSVQDIYQAGTGLAGKVSEVLTFAKATEHAVSVSGVDVVPGSIRLSFSCSTVDVKDSYVAYLNSKYTLSAVNEGQPIANTDGTTTYQYIATIIP